MRKFSLYIDGAEYKLNDEEGILFTSPTGLGAQLPDTSVNLNNGFFRAIGKEELPQMALVGTLIFRDAVLGEIPLTAYQMYHYFVGTLMRAEKIEFAYTPYGDTEYRKEVSLSYVTKTELEVNRLSCPVSFKSLTPWYTVDEQTVTLQVSQDEVNVYTAEIRPTGDMDAAIVLTANGGTPQVITAFTVDDDNVLGMLALDPAKEVIYDGSLEFSSKYEDSHAIFTHSGQTVDMVNAALLNSGGEKMFFRLPPYKKSLLTVLYSATASKPTSITAKIYSYFGSV